MMMQAQEEDGQEENRSGSDFDVDKTSSPSGTERKLKKS